MLSGEKDYLLPLMLNVEPVSYRSNPFVRRVRRIRTVTSGFSPVSYRCAGIIVRTPLSVDLMVRTPESVLRDRVSG